MWVNKANQLLIGINFLKSMCDYCLINIRDIIQFLPVVRCQVNS
jgi:hypothetical protein